MGAVLAARLARGGRRADAPCPLSFPRAGSGGVLRSLSCGPGGEGKVASSASRLAPCRHRSYSAIAMLPDNSVEHGSALQRWPTPMYWPSLCRRHAEVGRGRLRCLFGGWRYACIVAFPSLRCCRQFCRAWLGTTGLADAGALALPLPQARGGWEGRLRRLLRGWCYACIGAFPSLRCCGQFCRAWLGTTGLADADVLALPLPQTRG